MAHIHATALVDAAAQIADDVEIGAYSIIGPGVTIGPGTVVGSHVVIDGLTTIGQDNRIAPHCTLGGPPQDKKYAGEPTRLVIGDRNTIRECCTFSTGTVQDAGVTRMGDDNWIMAYVHVAHDCVVGSQTIMANCTQLAGHVHIGDWAILGGFSAVHQFVQIGAHAMIGMHSALSQDVPPFVLCAGMPTEPHGINVEGLKRRGFSTESISTLRQAYKLLYRSGLGLEDARKAIASLSDVHPEAVPHLGMLSAFLESSKRGIIR